MNAAQAETTPQPRRVHQPLTIPDLSKLPDGALLVSRQVAALAGYTEPALKKWRREGRGPQFLLVEGRPRYRVADVRTWLGAGR
jgi:hypothetical protein